MLFLLIALNLLLCLNAYVDPKTRIDCDPRPGTSKDRCMWLGCYWDNNFDDTHPTTPLCVLPPDVGYNIKNQTDGYARLTKRESGIRNPYDEDFKEIDFKYRKLNANVLKVTIGTDDRFVPLVPILNEDAVPSIQTDEKLTVEISDNPVFSFKIGRESNNVDIWDTSIGGLIFSDKYIQIATYLPSDMIYGFGENIHPTLKHDFTTYKTNGLFARDESPEARYPNGRNYYGIHPFYIGIEPNGKAHGVLFFNVNAQDYTTGPAPHLIYRTIGGQLDMYFFAGPTPNDVVRQYHELIGKPFLPAYWGLGYQFCRYGYKNTDEIKSTIKRITDAQIPIDVVYSDIDYMDRFKDFTYDLDNFKDLPAYTNELHEAGRRLVLIFDPAIQADYDVFQRAIDQKASFIEWPRADMVPHYIQDGYPIAKDTNVMLGVVWPDKHVAFPDFLDPTNRTYNWWLSEFREFYKKVQFDGIWIDMNEPSCFQTNIDPPYYPEGHPVLKSLQCPYSGDDAKYDVPPYMTYSVYARNENSLSFQTMCMISNTVGGKHKFYDTHSLYGIAESIATFPVLKEVTGKRGYAVTRSTFVGSGKYTGHWLGDNRAQWDDLRSTIIGVQEFNMFGITYVGSDVCGFIYPTNEELCLRWQQLGAFHSFFRNHNSIGEPPQDPPQWKSVELATRVANLYRYQLLPYLYTLHFKAFLEGGTVVRPPFFEFPLDSTTHTLSYEFMWGSSILVIPVTDPFVDSVHGYLPEEAEWYSISDAHMYGSLIPSGYSTFNAPRNTPLPTFLRAGYIIPRQRPALTTFDSRQNEFQLLIGLARAKNEYYKANGELYWDDGETAIDDINNHNYYHFDYSINVDKDESQLVINCDLGYNLTNKVELPTLNTIEILGYPFKLKFSSFKLNGNTVKIDTQKSTYYPLKKRLVIDTNALINLNENGPKWTLTWENI